MAVGISGGFMEPLEASALVMVELAASYIAQHLPKNNVHLTTVARRFNKTFTYRWEQVVEFIKLHYILSKRDDSQYWIDMRDQSMLSSDMQERLALWQYQVPSVDDFSQLIELFPSASYQYILYGMDYPTQVEKRTSTHGFKKNSITEFENVARIAKQKLMSLKTNRELLLQIEQHGLKTV